MSRTFDELLEHALTLPEGDGAELVELSSAWLHPQPGSLDPTWGPEMSGRAAEVASGQVEPVAWKEVRRQLRADLDAPDHPRRITS